MLKWSLMEIPAYLNENFITYARINIKNARKVLYLLHCLYSEHQKQPILLSKNLLKNCVSFGTSNTID